MGIKFLLAVCALFFCSCSSGRLTSIFSNQYDVKEIDNVTIVYSEIETKDENFFGVDKMSESTYLKLNKDFIDTLAYIAAFEGKKISTKYTHIANANGEKTRIRKEGDRLKEKFSELTKNHPDRLNYQPEIDYSENLGRKAGEYGLYINVYPESYMSQSVGPFGVGSTTINEEGTVIFGYLVDIQTDSLVWIYSELFSEQIENIELSDLSRIILMNLLYDKDVEITSFLFNFDSERPVIIEYEDKSKIEGIVLDLKGLVLEVESKGEIIEQHLSMVKMISRPAYKGAITHTILYSAN